MAMIAVDKVAWDALTDAQREGIRYWSEYPTLGTPAEFVDETGTLWCVFDDARISEGQVALVAAYMADPASIPAAPEEPSA